MRMKKPLILLSTALLFAVAAAVPKDTKLDYDMSVFDGTGGPYEAAGGTAPSAAAYRPCRPGPGDDNCIQLYERRVRAALPRRTAARRGPQARPAIGGPIEGGAGYPQCSRVLTDECVQLFDRAPRRGPPRRRAPPPEPSTPGI